MIQDCTSKACEYFCQAKNDDGKCDCGVVPIKTVAILTVSSLNTVVNNNYHEHTVKMSTVLIGKAYCYESVVNCSLLDFQKCCIIDVSRCYVKSGKHTAEKHKSHAMLL